MFYQDAEFEKGTTAFSSPGFQFRTYWYCCTRKKIKDNLRISFKKNLVVSMSQWSSSLAIEVAELNQWPNPSLNLVDYFYLIWFILLYIILQVIFSFLTSSTCAATTLTGMHFATTTLMTAVLRWLGYIQPSHLPLSELLKFILFANFSIVGMNVSLMWNSVGFYQVLINAIHTSWTKKKFKRRDYLGTSITTFLMIILCLALSDCKIDYDSCLLLVGNCVWQDPIFERHKA